MAVKYQVFVSSTYEDLKTQREQVIKAVLEMGHIPVGMEMFSAADEEQWRIITRQIDQSDYYAVIVAHRYGSIVEGISYTEKEYDYALQQGVPAIGFIIDHTAPWPTDRVDTESVKKEALDRFKDKLKRKPVGFWTSEEDLHGKFSIAFMKLINTNPRPGWARATEIVGPEVMRELSRLSSENASLRSQLEVALHKAEDDMLAQRAKVISTLKRNKIMVRLWYKYATKWSEPIETTLYRLFSILAPELQIEKSTFDAAKLFGYLINSDKSRGVRDEWPLASNSFRLWLSDLVTLGLIAPSSRKHQVSDKNEYWALTEEGREVYAMLRRVRLEEGENSSNGTDSELQSGEDS